MPDLPLNIARTTGKNPDIPAGAKIGDFLVARYAASEWARHFPWVNWHHAAMVTKTNPLTIIESSGILLQRENKKNKKKEVREGVVEYEFLKPRTVINMDGSENPSGNLWLTDDIIEVLWLTPVFPKPLREIDHWLKPWRRRKIITETDARKRAVAYAQNQLGEPYDLGLGNPRNKWQTKKWYCSLLIFKSYSRTVTNMKLESYEPFSGTHVTPEDLLQSKRSAVYHQWVHKKTRS